MNIKVMQGGGLELPRVIITKVTYSGSGGRNPRSKTKPLVKIDFDDVPGGEIHEAKSEASDDPYTDIEDDDGGFRGQMDVNSGNEEPKCGDGDAEDGDKAMA